MTKILRGPSGLQIKKHPQNCFSAAPACTIPSSDKHSSLAGLLFIADPSTQKKQPVKTNNKSFKTVILPSPTESQRSSRSSTPSLVSAHVSPISATSPHNSKENSPVSSKTNAELSVLTPPNIVTRCRRSLKKTWHWCQFQYEGWFKWENIAAEGFNFVTRTSTYIAKGAALGAIVGTFTPFPGLGTAVGLTAGALSGFLCGVVVSIASILLKPISAATVRYLKDKGSKNYNNFFIAGQGAILGATLGTFIPIPGVGTLVGALLGVAIGAVYALGMTAIWRALKSCVSSPQTTNWVDELSRGERKSIDFIYHEWLQKKLMKKIKDGVSDDDDIAELTEVNEIINQENGDHALVNQWITHCLPNEDSQLAKLVLELDSKLPQGLFQNNVPQASFPTQETTYESDCLQKEAKNQSLKYNVVRNFAAGQGSLLPAVGHNGDLSQAANFPMYSIVGDLLSGNQSATAKKARKILESPILGTASGVIGGALTGFQLAQNYVPEVEHFTHGLQTVNPISYAASIAIHYVKERALVKKDFKIKEEIATFEKQNSKKIDLDNSLIWKKLARIVRHELTKNIPKTLNLMTDLSQEISVLGTKIIKLKAEEKHSEVKKMDEKMGKLFARYQTARSYLRNFSYHVDLYHKYRESYRERSASCGG